MTLFLSLLAGFLVAMGGPVTGLSIHPAPERTEVVISMGGQAQYRDFTMEAPNRLVLDLMGAQHALPQDNFMDIHRGGIRAIRTSQYSEDIVRVVIELEEVVGYQIIPSDGQIRVVLENRGEDFAPWSTLTSDRSAGPSAPRPNNPAPRTRSVIPAPRTRSVVPAQQAAQRITVTFSLTPLSEVLFIFAEFADRSIVPGADINASVTAEIRDQPWDVALREILESHGLVAQERESGIIRVDALENLSQRELVEPPSTRAFSINYGTAAEAMTAVQALLTPQRGQASVAASTNTLIVTDVVRVLDQVETLIAELDRETAQVGISAKIMFINRTDLRDFGVTYDLKDSEGNQLNVLTPGAMDMNGDGFIDPATETVPVGTNVVSLGGNSLAALGNARVRVPNPAMTLLTSLVIGRHTLVNFIEALESMNLSDIQAHPSVTVMDNQQARILVGEETPIRVLDAGAGGGVGGIPTAQVQIRPTGIILEATPHVTASGKILLQLHAERSAAIPAESDAGFIFQTQEADSRVLVDDGETIVIAGLTVTETSEVRSGIPLLMDLPLIGPLFRVTRESTVQRDLMILVTPTIIRSNWN
jgi:type IV pilus assembly protein PilQ